VGMQALLRMNGAGSRVSAGGLLFAGLVFYMWGGFLSQRVVIGSLD